MAPSKLSAEESDEPPRAAARVQVVIPTYNRLAYLQCAIASVLSQTYADSVLHISDNASTDGTSEWLASLDDPRVTHSRHASNVGWRENINSCFDHIPSGTTYAVILHDDDFMHPRYLEDTVALLDANPRAGFVHTAFDIVSADGRQIRDAVNWTHGLSTDVVETGVDFIEESIRWNCRVCSSTALLRCAAIPQIRFLAIDGSAPDVGFWLRIAMGWDVGFIATPLIGWRVHAGSTSGSAEIGEPQAEGYAYTLEMIDAMYGVVQRFLADQGSALLNAPELRRLAKSVYRGGLIANAAGAAGADQRRIPGLKRLAEAARHDVGIVRDPRAWRLLASTLAGPALTDRIRAAKRHVRPAG